MSQSAVEPPQPSPGPAGQPSHEPVQHAEPPVPRPETPHVAVPQPQPVVSCAPVSTPTQAAPTEPIAEEDVAAPIPAAPEPPVKARRSKARRTITTIAAAASIMLVISAAVFVVWGIPKPKEPRAIDVAIPRGLNAEQIGKVLQSRGVIDSPFAFKMYAELHGASNKLQPGRYVLREDMEYKKLVAALIRGPKKASVVEVTIPEGFTIRQVAERVAAHTGLDPMELAVLAGTKAQTFRYEFLVSDKTGSLEGYLFPKTYGIPKSADEHWVVDKMLAQFEKETAHLDWTAARKRNLTAHEVITIASLIEREARLASERRLISAVIHNRLRKRIALRIDATVQYGLPEWKDRLNYEDLKVDSPYNTYLHQGLPPGPIANPGLESIKAALNPAKVDYLYYVLTDPRGKHTFTRTYEEFLRAKAASKAR